MGELTIQDRADRVAALIEERLGVKGKDLPTKLRKAGRRIPSAIQTEVRFLDSAAMQAQNPKLAFQIDEVRVARAYEASVRFLNAADRKARRRAMLMGMASSIAFSIFAVGVIFLVVLYWRGLIG